MAGGLAGPLRERVVLWVFTAGWSLVRAMPERLARAVFTLVADLAWWRRGRGVRQLEANLSRVLGPGAPAEALRQASRAGMRSYLRYWCEAFRMPAWSREDLLARVRVVGDVDGYRRAVATGSGYVAALPHMGNWDLAGAWSCLQGGAVVTVAERLQPEALYDRFVTYRESLGMRVLPLTGSRSLVDELASAAAVGKVVCLLADRDLRETGLEVDLFGEAARIPSGPALLALRTGAPLHPVTVSYDADGVVIHFHPRVPVPESGTTRARATAMTRALTAAFEEAIREAPQDWHMLQPLWSADLERSPEPAGAGR
ncbi:MAG: phosphatidylinositol mannoside acyltransferase [Actinomycetota bacterium]|nr:phosphatidylinositol mannoside acyltransferase [Actinomycetota bacterium]